MDSDFLKSVLGQRAPAQGPLSQLPLFQTVDSPNAPGTVPPPPPGSGALAGGYPGQPAPPAYINQQPLTPPTQLPPMTPPGGDALQQWRMMNGKAGFTEPPTPPDLASMSNGPGVDAWRMAHGKMAAPAAAPLAAAPLTNGDVVSAAIKGVVGAPQALTGAPAPQVLTGASQASQRAPQAFQHNNELTQEFLNTLPASQAAAITAAGGITMGHMMHLLTANAQLNDPLAQGRQRYLEHANAMTQLQQKYPGLGISDKGELVIPKGLSELKDERGAPDNAGISNIVNALRYHRSGMDMYKSFIYPLNSMVN